jgi:hypothetical protein
MSHDGFQMISRNTDGIFVEINDADKQLRIDGELTRVGETVEAQAYQGVAFEKADGLPAEITIRKL